MTDAECVGLSSVRRRDRSAANNLYYNIRRKLVQAVRLRCVHTDIDPEDVVQSAFERLAAGPRTKGSSNAFQERKFLWVTALNVLSDQIRQDKERTSIYRYLELVGPFESIDELTPEHILASRRNLEVVNRALANLPVSGRQMVLDLQIEGQPIRDVARKFNIPRTTVSEIVSAALRDCSRELR